MSSIGRITRFGLRNFKAFHYLEDIELKPLTVLVGANSSGKSSILQALLLLKQSSEAPRSAGVLKFDGEWTRLGTYANVVSDFDVTRDIEYRFEIDAPRCDIRLVFGMNGDAAHVLLKHGSLHSRFREHELTVKYGTKDPPKLEDDSKPDLQLSSAKVDRFWLESYELTKRTARGEKGQLAYSVTYGVSGAIPLRTLIEQRLEYLGPVRADPRPFYPVEEEPALGSRGEGTIPYLLRHQHDLVRYAPSPSKASEALQEAPLLEAVNDWLRRMRVTSELTISPVESIAFTAAIQSASATKRSVNLSQVGFGVGQLLPVLVMGLKGPEDAWLLYEQPEIHLHPRLQGELGDFFLATARSGKTVMVETHSDHLVNRLRRRIAEDGTGELSKMVQILFVHAGTAEEPGSYVEPLTVDESGSIVNCPADFFSESADEAFAILASRREQAKGKKGG